MFIRQQERHRTHHIGWLRAAVLGANDGIVSTASLSIGADRRRRRAFRRSFVAQKNFRDSVAAEAVDQTVDFLQNRFVLVLFERPLGDEPCREP